MYRQKKIEITDDMVAQIEKVTGTSVDTNDIVVFEAIAASTRPISKLGSIYDGAMISQQLLQDMAEAVNSGSESVPLHTMHMQGSELPIGRVFKAWVQDAADGSANLHTYFYLPSNEKDLIEKISLSVLDEVSVGMKSQQALCSKCGFDYFGPDADFTHLFSQTCDNGHTISEGGTHLKLTGLDMWTELSLVSRGASNKAKILSRARNSVSQEAVDRMAASGTPVEAALLVTNLSEMEPEMPKEETLSASEGEDTIEAVVTEEEQEPAAETEAEEPVAEAEEEEEAEPELDIAASINALTERLGALEAQINPEPEAEAEAEDLQAQLAAAQARIAELEAAEEPAIEEPEAPKPNIPVGGMALSAVEDAKSKPTQLRASAFKTTQPRKK